ncbi:MAG: hypothetical protein LBG88_00450 [Christensenellaceae bacterium]|jgi:hypothetical protein|nr:hypothetical protein [Christensenellaceae bacterium]
MKKNITWSWVCIVCGIVLMILALVPQITITSGDGGGMLADNRLDYPSVITTERFYFCQILLYTLTGQIRSGHYAIGIGWFAFIMLIIAVSLIVLGYSIKKNKKSHAVSN